MDLSGRGRVAALGIACLAVGAAFGPTFATAATSFKDVIVANADDDPVPIKAIDPIPVNGTVNVGNTTTNPAIVKSVGTTQVGGDVAVPGGVAVTNKPTVKIDDSTPLAVTGPAPERFQLGVEASTTTTPNSPGGTQCEYITPPEGKRYVIEAAHLEGRFSGDANPGLGYVHVEHIVQTEHGVSAAAFRIAPEWRETFASDRFAADVEGPYIADGSTRKLAFCVQILGFGTAVLRGTVNGTVENL